MSQQISSNELIQAESAFGFGQHRVVETTSNVLFACQINSDNEIEVYTSSDEGSSWSIDTTFTGLTTPRKLSMCVSERGDIFLCFTNNSKYIVIKRKHYSTGVWSEVLNYQQDGMTNGHLVPALITYNRYINRLHVFWAMNNKAGDNSYYNINNKYSDDYGDNWSNGTGYGSSSATVAPALWSIASDPVDGNVLVQYTYGSSDWAVTTNTNEFTSAGVRVNTWGGNKVQYSHYIGVAISPEGVSYDFQFYVRSGYNDKLIVREHTGISSYTSRLDEDLGGQNILSSGEGCIASDGSGNIFIFYTKKTDLKCYYRKYDKLTTSWTSETAVSSGEGRRPTSSEIILSAFGKLRLLYTAS